MFQFPVITITEHCRAFLRRWQHRISLLAISAIMAIVFPGANAKFANADQAPRPNIILIMADDIGYECITANGGESYQTPVLDGLAAKGMRFENCHVQPLCTPTRVQIMTGLYNVKNYVRFNMMPRDAVTFGHLLQQAGYATAVCGKWQLGREQDSPQHFGFSQALLWQHTRRPPRYANPGLELNGAEQEYPVGSYGPDLINEFARDFISRQTEAHPEQPFFLYYPMILVHSPFQPTPDSPNWDPKAQGERVNNRPQHFADMTAYMDQLIGRLDAHLEKLGIRDNTLLLFLGDNGTHPSITSQWNGKPYPGGKKQTTRNGTHVPFIASWPAVIPPGTVNRDLISAADFLPTLCEAAEISVPTECDGVSFLPQLRGKAGQPRESIYVWFSPRQQDDMTVVEYAFDHHYKLYGDGRFFDLSADPDEQHPLLSEGLEGTARTAQEKLRRVLVNYSSARPAALDDEFRRFIRSTK